ncbi:MAG: hypothetical protein ACJATI_003858, partial [Halioglobus sp.]
MKSLLTTLVLSITSIFSLISQDFNVYPNNINETPINGDFIPEVLYLEPVVEGSSVMRLKSDYFISLESDGETNSTVLFNNFPIDITALLGDPEDGVTAARELMVMYHLNKARIWALGQNLSSFPYPFSVPIEVVREKIKQEPTLQINEATDEPMIEYSVSDPNIPGTEFKAMAEDAYAIVRAYFMLTYQALANGATIKGEGTDLAIGTYFAHRYMTDPENGFNLTSETHSWGGTSNNLLNNDAWVAIYSDFSFQYYSGNYSSPINKHEASERLFATLWILGNQLGFDKVDRLIVNSLSTLIIGSESPNMQFVAAVKLYDNASIADNNLSDADRCALFKYFRFVYGDDFVNSITTLPVGVDFMIRDSERGQYSWSQQEDQKEDIGDEKNERTTDFARSPDLWNSLTQSPDNDKEHENPEYNGNTPNYLYVEVRAKGCETVDQDDMLHVYISESHLSSDWPLDWTDKYYIEDGVPTSVKIGYEITSGANNSLLDPNADGISMAAYVYTYTEEFTYEDDNENEITDYWTVYRYEIPWIPINPDDIPKYVNVGGSIHACLLARIVTETVEGPGADPMTFPEGAGAWINNENNNNIAIRNTSIHSEPPGIAGGGGNGSGVITGLNIKSPPIITGDPEIPGPTGDPEIDIEIAIHPNNDYTDDGDPIIPSTKGPGDPVIFEYVNVEIILSDEFLAEWTSSGLQGSGFTWINANTIKVTSPTFNIKAIKLPPRKDHRIFVKTTSTQDFT